MKVSASIRDKRLACSLAVVCALLFLTACGCTSSDETPSIGRPASIVVYSDGAVTEYTETDPEYVMAFDLLKDTQLNVPLETAVDPDMETSLKEGDCIEFIYDVPQHTQGNSSEADSVVREYDRLLFWFEGPITGEAVLGLDGRYMSGTYAMGATAWPY